MQCATVSVNAVKEVSLWLFSRGELSIWQVPVGGSGAITLQRTLAASGLVALHQVVLSQVWAGTDAGGVLAWHTSSLQESQPLAFAHAQPILALATASCSAFQTESSCLQTVWISQAPSLLREVTLIRQLE